MVNSLCAAEGGLIYHALNRANARLTIFADEDDYAAFDRALAESVARHDIRLVAYKVLPNHFHLVLWPGVNGELSRFMKWLTLTHTQRWHGHRHSAGTGHLDQGRFKSFPVRDDGHLVTVWRYMERNALRVGMVTRAEDWPRCSLRRLAATAPSGGEGTGAERMARRATARLGRSRQPADDRRGGGSDAQEPGPRPALRCAAMAGEGRRPIGPAIRLPRKGSPPTHYRFLTPISPFSHVNKRRRPRS